MPFYEEYVTTAMAAQICGCSEAVIHGAARRGRIKRYGTPRQPAWKLAELQKWQESPDQRRGPRVA